MLDGISPYVERWNTTASQKRRFRGFDSHLGHLNKEIMAKKKKKSIIRVPESEWKDSKFRTPAWESRVNITRWEHDYEAKEYIITLG